MRALAIRRHWQTSRALAQENAELMAQRDEALAALKRLLHTLESCQVVVVQGACERSVPLMQVIRLRGDDVRISLPSAN